MIDYKGGKVIWDNSHNWEREEALYEFKQDILQIKYGDNCVIDVGSYADIMNTNKPRFFIKVVDYSPYPNDDDKPNAWSLPYASIPCQSKQDMLVQLQRAIDTYPLMINTQETK